MMNTETARAILGMGELEIIFIVNPKGLAKRMLEEGAENVFGDYFVPRDAVYTLSNKYGFKAIWLTNSEEE